MQRMAGPASRTFEGSRQHEPKVWAGRAFRPCPLPARSRTLTDVDREPFSPDFADRPIFWNLSVEQTTFSMFLTMAYQCAVMNNIFFDMNSSGPSKTPTEPPWPWGRAIAAWCIVIVTIVFWGAFFFASF